MSRLVVFSFLVTLFWCNSQVKQPDSLMSQFDKWIGEFLGVSGKDLTGMNLRNVDLSKLVFDSFTRWPSAEWMPERFEPEKVIEWGKTPGLGIKALHARGITGKGVHVAVIDQPLLKDHIEYLSQLLQYTLIDCEGVGPQIHGAVASLFVGQHCGVAPGALLHYWAEPMWKKEYRTRCEALSQIIQCNKDMSLADKIQVVSVSLGFREGEPALDEWKHLLDSAKSQGIYVVHCDDAMHGVGCPVFSDKDDPGSYDLCYFSLEGGSKGGDALYAPIDNRTTGHFKHKEGYIFWWNGGLSWGAPFIAGVVALGFQVNPNLTPDQVRECLYSTGTPFKRGRIINPAAFVAKVVSLK